MAFEIFEKKKSKKHFFIDIDQSENWWVWAKITFFFILHHPKVFTLQARIYFNLKPIVVFVLHCVQRFWFGFCDGFILKIVNIFWKEDTCCWLNGSPAGSQPAALGSTPGHPTIPIANFFDLFSDHLRECKKTRFCDFTRVLKRVPRINSSFKRRFSYLPHPPPRKYVWGGQSDFSKNNISKRSFLSCGGHLCITFYGTVVRTRHAPAVPEYSVASNSLDLISSEFAAEDQSPCLHKEVRLRHFLLRSRPSLLIPLRDLLPRAHFGRSKQEYSAAFFLWCPMNLLKTHPEHICLLEEGGEPQKFESFGDPCDWLLSFKKGDEIHDWLLSFKHTENPLNPLFVLR